MSHKKKWVDIFVIVFLIAVVAACTTQPQQEQEFSTPPVFATENPYFEVPRVTLEEAKAAFDSGSAVFVDTRRGATEADSHIPGALLISIDDIESRMNELDPDQWIITYCTWPNEETSARAAKILLDNGFTRVNPILGGFRAWLEAGYPVEP